MIYTVFPTSDESNELPQDFSRLKDAEEYAHMLKEDFGIETVIESTTGELV